VQNKQSNEQRNNGDEIHKKLLDSNQYETRMRQLAHMPLSLRWRVWCEPMGAHLFNCSKKRMVGSGSRLRLYYVSVTSDRRTVSGFLPVSP
jgi:hypothetical protein